jgi:hypothetical protein
MQEVNWRKDIVRQSTLKGRTEGKLPICQKKRAPLCVEKDF